MPVCPVVMHNNLTPCGRDVAPSPHDDTPVCLMHSRNPDKDPRGLVQIIGHAFGVGPAADFSHAVFPAGWSFPTPLLRGGARELIFRNATFTHTPGLAQITFADRVDFGSATFLDGASFHRVTFRGVANFTKAHFVKKADFSKATFQHPAIFVETIFDDQASYREAHFTDLADFTKAEFADLADFALAEFDVPQRARFHELNRARRRGARLCFFGCRIEDLNFLDVNWYTENRRLMLFDEIRTRYDNGGYELVAALYRQLVGNFEKQRDHDHAEQAYIGVMEMGRRDPSHFARLLMKRPGEPCSGLRRVLGVHLSTMGLYRLVSRYGTNYWRAAGVLVVLLLLLGLAYTVTPVRLRLQSHPRRHLGYSERLVPGLIHAAQVGTFQRERRYKADSNCGAAIDTLAAVLMPAQAAMLLLALRRRFRR